MVDEVLYAGLESPNTLDLEVPQLWALEESAPHETAEAVGVTLDAASVGRSGNSPLS